MIAKKIVTGMENLVDALTLPNFNWLDLLTNADGFSRATANEI